MPVSFNAGHVGYDAGDALTLGHCAEIAYLPDGKSIGGELAQRFGLPDCGQRVAVFNAGNIQAYAFNGPEEVIVAYRGTEPSVLRDWYTDFDTKFVDCVIGSQKAGRVHQGFWDGVDSVWSALVAQLRQWSVADKPLWICGHSLGGALAVLTAARLCMEADLAPALTGLYTFGQPRVGDADFVRFLNGPLAGRFYRFVNNLDIVPHVPPALISGYRHGGTMVYFDENGQPVISPTPVAALMDDVVGEVKALARIDPAAQITDHLMRDYLPLLVKAAAGAPS